MFRLLARALAIAALLHLAGCGDKGSPASPPPDVAVEPRDSRATVTWTAEPGVEYWLFYAPTSNITRENWATLPGIVVIKNAVSPITVSGLRNGTTYSFMVNGRTNNGPGGAASPSISIVPRLAGASWTIGAPAGSDDLLGATFGSVFVAVGANGTIQSSPDGKIWTAQSSGITTALNAAVYFGGTTIAAGAGGVILRSTDTVAWAPQISATGNDLHALATNGAGTYVAVGAQGTIVTSSDGQTWSQAVSSTVVTSSPLYGVTFGNGLYVAVGAGGVLLTSTDASTWQAVTSGTTSDLRSIAFGAGVYAAVGASGTLVTSPDGVTWTAQTALGSNILASVTFGRQFVAVGHAGAIYTSTDGVAWQAQTSGTTGNLYAIARSTFEYAAVGAAGLNLHAK